MHRNKRTGEQLVVHLARDIGPWKRQEELLQQIVTVSHKIVALEKKALGAAPVSPLSGQELEILSKFAAGAEPRQIVKDLKISPQTLRNHLHHINQKLRTHNRLEAVMHALQRGLI